MAVEFLDFQVIEFEDQNQEITKGFLGSDDFVQLVDVNDFTKFQVKSDPEPNAPNTLSAVADDGWDRTTGSAEYEGNNDDLRFDASIFEGYIYVLNFTVSGMTSGSLFVGALSSLQEIQADGVYSLIVVGDSDEDIVFRPTTTLNSGVTVSAYSCYELPRNYKAGIYNTLDTLQSEITAINYSRQYATFTADWNAAGLSPGTYKFGLFDGGNRMVIENGGFDTTANWVLATGVNGNIEISDSLLKVSTLPPPSPVVSTATYAGAVEDGKDYEITIYVKDARAGILQVNIGANSTSVFANAGVHSEILTADGSTLEIEISTFGNNNNVEIEAIYVTEVVDLANETPEYFTNELCLQANEADTIILSWCNLNDAQGLGYGDTQFVNIIRTAGKVVHPKGADQEYIKNILSDGDTKVFYHRETEVFDLITGFLPMRLHRALKYARGADFFAIDNQGFKFQEGDYEPQWSENSDYIASVTLEVYRSIQALPKIRCTAGANPDCSFPPNCIIDENGDELGIPNEAGCILAVPQF